jgi:hypothetical protein
MPLRTLTTVDSLYSIICENPREHKSIEIVFGWEPGHIWLHTTLKGPWPHYMISEVCWDNDLWTLCLWALKIPRSRLLACVWRGPQITYVCVHLRSQVAPYRPHIFLVTFHGRMDGGGQKNLIIIHIHKTHPSIHPPISGAPLHCILGGHQRGCYIRGWGRRKIKATTNGDSVSPPLMIS